MMPGAQHRRLSAVAPGTIVVLFVLGCMAQACGRGQPDALQVDVRAAAIRELLTAGRYTAATTSAAALLQQIHPATDTPPTDAAIVALDLGEPEFHLV